MKIWQRKKKDIVEKGERYSGERKVIKCRKYKVSWRKKEDIM